MGRLKRSYSAATPGRPRLYKRKPALTIPVDALSGRRWPWDGTTMTDAGAMIRPTCRPGGSRREFLYVGLVGGLGLTLGELSRRRRSQRAARSRTIRAPKARPSRSSTSSCPAGCRRRSRSTPSRTRRSNTAGRSGRSRRRSPARCSARRSRKIAAHRRQDHDRPLDDARRGGARARHAQHVHRLPPEPGDAVPEHGQRGQPRVRPAEQPAAVRLHPERAQPVRRQRLSVVARTARSASAPTRRNGNFSVRDLNLPDGIDEPRFSRRRSMLSAVDDHFRKLEKSDALDAMDSFYQRAYCADQLEGGARGVRHRRRAGRDQGRVRQERSRHAHADVPAARRGGRAVRLDDLRRVGPSRQPRRPRSSSRCRSFDKALAALITDLERRGLLDSTLVMVTTEFGRTPKINKDNGRDHWPRVFSIVLAGGGIKKGQIYGASDATAAEPAQRPADASRTWRRRSTTSSASSPTRS